jgi:hypothetical protein
MLYMCGGNNGQEILDTFECYDLASKTCTRLPSLKMARDEVTLVELNGHLYAIGGGGKEGESLKSVEKYSFASNEWSLDGEMLIERRAHAAISMDGGILVIGGFDGEKYLRSCEK